MTRLQRIALNAVALAILIFVATLAFEAVTSKSGKPLDDQDSITIRKAVEG